MGWDVAGLGNALMDALVVVEDDQLIDDLGLARGTMHPVDHATWEDVFERVRHLEVTLESGGSCANTIATVGRLGGRAIYRGQVGNDTLGRIYANRMQDACGGHSLRFTDDQPTGKCLSIISKSDAERTMLTDLGAAVVLPELGEYEAVLTDTRIAHFTGYTLLDGPMHGVVTEAMTKAAAAGAKISIDVADPFVVRVIRDRLWAVIRESADIVFLNADEARGLTEQEPEEAIHTVAKQGHVETVVVKLGSQGSLIRHGDELYRIGIQPVRAVDTTGAGDAYAGGYLFGVIRGWDPVRCGQLASAVAALTVTQIGAVVKDREALARALAELAA